MAVYNESFRKMQNSEQRSLVHLKGPTQPQYLLEFLSQKLSISESQIQLCSNLGAIYLNQDRIFTNPTVCQNDSIRVYKFPRRFSPLALPLENYIVFESNAFLVGLKPPAMLTHGTADNFKENFVYLLSEKYGSLRAVQRLDFMTSGLITLARNENFARTFQVWNKQNKIKKRYLAWVEHPLALGCYQHEVTLGNNGFRIWSQEKGPGSKTCKMEILNITRAQPFGYELDVRLITGRTHQIRAQLAQLGSPIVGDTLYGSPHKNHPLRPSLTCVELELPRGPELVRYELPWSPFSAEMRKKEKL